MTDRISNEDKLNLDLHKSSLTNAQQGIQLAQTQAQLAQMNYQRFVEGLFKSYKLGEQDSIKPDGTIVRAPAETKEEAAQ